MKSIALVDAKIWIFVSFYITDQSVEYKNAMFRSRNAINFSFI